jgi:hypothetical protein
MTRLSDTRHLTPRHVGISGPGHPVSKSRSSTHTLDTSVSPVPVILLVNREATLRVSNHLPFYYLPCRPRQTKSNQDIDYLTLGGGCAVFKSKMTIWMTLYE